MKRNGNRNWVNSLICIALVFCMCVPQLLLQTGIVLAADEQVTDSEGGESQIQEGQAWISGSGESQIQESQAWVSESGEPQTQERQTVGSEGGENGEAQARESQAPESESGSSQTERGQEPESGSGGDQTEQEQISGSESGIESGTEETSEQQEARRDITDWTQDMGHLTLEIEKAVYLNKDLAKTSVLNQGGIIDLSKASPDEMPGLSFELSFNFKEMEGENRILAGDTFSIDIAGAAWTPDNEAAGEVRLYDKDIYRDSEGGMAQAGAAIGTYTVSGGTVTVTFNEKAEDIQGSEIFGVTSIPVKMDVDTLLTGQAAECEIILQPGRAVHIKLPHLSEEAESETELESVTDLESESGPGTGQKETNADGYRGQDLSTFRKPVMFFAEPVQGYSIQNPKTTSKTFKSPAEGVSKVKITLTGSGDGYMADSDLAVAFSIDIVLDDEYLYLQHSAHEGDAGYPAFGGDIESYNAKVDGYLEGLNEEELPSVAYIFNLGADFVLPGGVQQQEADLVYETGDLGTPEKLGKLTVEKQSEGNWTATVIFDKKVYNRESVTAGKTLDLQVAEDKLDEKEPVYVGWDGSLPKVGTMGSLTPDDPNKPQAPEYSVTKEAPASVSSPYIDYVISVNTEKEGKTLAEMILADVVPADMEVISVSRDGRELIRGGEFSEDTYLVTDAGELQYQFPAAADGQEVPAEAQFAVRLALTEACFKAAGGIVDGKQIQNTAYLKQKDGQTEAAHSDEVSTSMTIRLLEKDGRKDGLNGRRYSWTLDVNTQFSKLVGAYIIDTICWDDHMYDSSFGLQVYNEKGRLIMSLPMREKTAAGPVPYDSISKENIEGLAGGETNPFYYKYEEGGSTYAVLVIPYGSELQNQKLKLKYYTEVNMGDVPVDQWQDENSGQNKILTNKAKFIWNRYIYGNGPGLDDFEYNIDLSKEISDQITLGTKSAGNYDESTRRMQWQFTVNGYGANLNGMSVTDTLSPDKYELDSVLITYRKYLRDGSPSTLKKMGQDSTAGKPFYSLNTETGNINIQFGDVSQEEYYEIFLDVAVMDPEIMSDQGDSAGILSNTADFRAAVNGKDKENQLTAEKAVPNTLIAKEAVGGYDYSTRKISWKTTVDMNHTPITGMTLTDTLPAGSSFSELSGVTLVDQNGNTEEGKISGSTDGSTVEFDSGVMLTLDITEGNTADGNYTQDTVVFKFTDKNSAEQEYKYSFVVEYKTKFTDEAYLRYIFQNNTQVKVVNEVVLTGNVRGKAIQAGAAAAAALYIKNNKISKNGTYDKDEGLIHWKITVNESKADLQGMKIVDEMGNQPLEIDEGSVILSKSGSDGKITLLASSEGGNTDAEGFKNGLAVSPQEISYIIPEDYKTETLLLEFDTALTESASAGQISNKARLMNKDSLYQESDNSNGGYSGDFDMDAYVQSAKKPVFQILKTSSNDDRSSKKRPLEGAKFRLEAFMDVDRNGIYTPDSRYDKSGTTGTDGKLAFVNLKWDTVYHIIETEAAEGYQLTAEDRYYIFRKDTEEQEIQLNVNGDTKTVICMSGGTAVGTGDGEFAEANLVIHNAPKADLEIKFTKKYPDGNTAGKDEVEFKLKDKEGHLLTKSAVSDDNGIISFKGVDPGDYILTEVKSPDPYDQGASFDVTLKTDNTYTIALAGGNASVTTEPSQVSIVANAYARGTILLKKADSIDGHEIPLAGAEYTLCDDKGTPVKDEKGNEITAASGTDGIVCFKNVSYRPGGYILKETVPPEGYEQPGILQQVTVSAADMSASLAAASNSEGKAKTFTVDLSSEAERSNWQKNIRTKGSLSFTKVNDAASPQPVRGQEFKLLYNDSDGYNGWEKGAETGFTAKTDESGVFTFKDIPYGNYRLVEISSEGDIYQAYADDFTLREMMQASLDANRADADQDNENVFNITVAEPIVNTLVEGSFSLIKTDGATEEALEGVIFTLSGKNAYGEEIAVEKSSGTDGTIRFSNIPIGWRDEVSGNMKPYLLSEIQPDGYIMPEKYHVYIESVNKGTGGDIDNQAKISLVPLDASGNEKAEKTVVVDQGTPYAVQNTPIKGSLEFKKVSAGDPAAGLKGAEYTLYRLVGGARATEEQIQKNSGLSPVTETSGDDGIISFTDIEYGNYELAETKAPYGYQLDTAPVRVTKEMLKEGLSGDKSGFFITLADISDKPTSLSVKKQDQFGQTVTGAVLKLTGKFADEALTQTGFSWTTDGSTQDISQNLIVGESYTLTEVSAPVSGLYRTIEPLQFTVNDDGTVHITSGDTKEYSYSDGVLILKDHYYLAQVELTKTDSASGAGLPDIAFSLYKQAGETPDTGTDILITDSLATGEDGVWDSSSASDKDNPVTKGRLSDGLCLGKYYFIETSSDQGHKLDQTPKTFEVTPEAFAGIPAGEEPQIKVNVENAPIEVKLQKTDSRNGKMLEGAEFILSDLTGSSSETVVTGEDGTVILPGIVSGSSYRVEEIKAPAGYILKDSHPAAEFTVEADGKVSFTKADNISGNESITGDKSDTVIFSNTPVKAAIRKLSPEGIELTGWKFTVTGIFAEGNGKAASSQSTIDVSDSSPEIPEGRLIAGNSYQVKEIKAPSGYIRPEGEYTIHVNSDGTLALDPDSEQGAATDNSYVETTGALLEVTDQPLRFGVDKVSNETDESQPDQQERVAGAELEIKDESGNPLEPATGWTSGETEPHMVRELPAGVYQVVETKAPYGYCTADPVVFRLYDNNTIEVLSGPGEVAAGDGGIQILKMTDVVVRGHVKLQKMRQSETDRQPLENAAFDLYMQKGENADISEDILVSEDILTDASGSWTTDGNTALRRDNARPLSEGLRAGMYYFYETEAGRDTWLDPDGRIFGFEIEEKDHGTVAEVNAVNKAYVSQVCLKKVDSVDETPVSEAEFTLLFESEGQWEMVKAQNTDENGDILFELKEKGRYRLIETKAAFGYQLDEDAPYTAEFTADDRSYGMTLVLQEEIGQQEAEAFSPVQKNVIYKGGSVANLREPGTLELTKTGRESQILLNGVEFTLYRANGDGQYENAGSFLTGKHYKNIDGQFDGQENEDGKLKIEGLDWGNYYIQETKPLDGYQINDSRFEFMIGRLNGEIMLRSDQGTIINEKTNIFFYKFGRVMEDCADPEIGGVPGPGYTIPVSGAEFTMYRDEQCSEEVAIVKGISGQDGLVEFTGLPEGTYYMKETKAPEGYLTDDTVYKACLDKNGMYGGLYTAEDEEIADITVINDVLRTDITLRKVSEQDMDLVLPGSEYGLYKKTAQIPRPQLRAAMMIQASENPGNVQEEEWTLIARAVTDVNGIITFKGVLMDTEYLIRELKAPDGSQVSANPVSIRFTADESGKVRVSEINDGDKTAVVDPDTGEIIWREPPIMLGFWKRDTDGNALAGAKLQLQDMEGKVIDEWISSDTEPHIIYGDRMDGMILAGQQYQLVETAAPQGYAIAKPVIFKVIASLTGPDQNAVQEVVMTDEKIQPETPPAEETEPETPSTEEPVTEAPGTEEPPTEEPVTEAPSTEAPSTEEPVTEAPATETPSTKGPGTEAPSKPQTPETKTPSGQAAAKTADNTPVLWYLLVMAAAAAVCGGLVIYRKRKR